MPPRRENIDPLISLYHFIGQDKVPVLAINDTGRDSWRKSS